MARQSHAPAHPVTPVGMYIGVFLTLMVLTLVTVVAAKFDLGALNTPIALGIAGTKATVVVLFFMELRHARLLTKLAAVVGIAWLAILLIFLFSDYGSRSWIPTSPTWVSPLFK